MQLIAEFFKERFAAVRSSVVKKEKNNSNDRQKDEEERSSPKGLGVLRAGQEARHHDRKHERDQEISECHDNSQNAELIKTRDDLLERRDR
jgi:hypothetical protein